MSYSVALTMGMRNGITSIGEIAMQTTIANKRLSTGKKVNDVLDNATNFFVARSMVQLASDLSTIQDGMGLGAKVIEVATKALDGMDKLLSSAQGLLRQARSITDPSQRLALGEQARDLYAKVDDLRKDAGFNGTNLLKDTAGVYESLTVLFNTETLAANQTKITVQLTAADDLRATNAAGLNLKAVTWNTTGAGADAIDGPVGDTNLDTELARLSTAITKVRSVAAKLSAQLTVVKVRQEYTTGKNMSLKAGSDGLTLADMNEEGANLAALSTRQQLAVQALSLANQSDQGILRLF
jgi:flagellin